MSRGDRLIAGAIYVGGFALVEFRLRDWRLRIDEVVAAGGFRRAEGGETFLHGSDGRLVAEAWAIVQPRKGAQS